ncbi:MAG: hypothetical protein K2H13_04200 [Eubacterium sp.]|nr:hypothetical protein [Eubacterium sp.]MDE6156297.1 hypothetical protein [Eubacterium sp.]MDE6767304.1 hypothetical protein [Eubacterium sp.]
MNTKLKKCLSLLLALVILLGCFSVSFAAYAADDQIEISVENFPDPVFRSIVSKYDTSAPKGYLSASERNVSRISLTGYSVDSIKTLKGIEYFADSLKVLRCTDLKLEELDVSALINLTELTCMGNNLTKLDVSKNTNLVTLNCSKNQLTSLTLGSIDTLETLHCYINNLKSVAVSLLPNLKEFRCDQNQLTSVDLSFNTNLTYFTCASNHLTTLDLTRNTLLGRQDDGEYRTIARELIGDQTTTAAASMNSTQILIPFTIADESRVVATSLDIDELKGYYAGRFVAYDVADIVDGVDYTYSVNNEWVQDMEVNVEVSRDFYQVDFYYDEDMTELIGRTFVNDGQAAKAPSFTPPLCNTLDCWSDDISNVTGDMKVYGIFKDAHSYKLVSFVDGIATLECTVCGDNQKVKFIDCVNAASNDANYYSCLDVVADGCINTKDYAELVKMFK